MRADARQLRRRASRATRPISRPVASCACSTRRTLCAPSLASAGCPSAVAIELHAPLDQLADVSRTVLDQHWTARVVAEAVAGGHRVGGVQFGRIVRAERRGNATLRITGIAFVRIRLW